MAIHATARLENVKVSIEKFIYDNLSTLTIDWEGLPFESGATNINSWIQPRLLGFIDPAWKPKSSTTRRGNRASCMLNTNIFVKRDWASATSRHYEIRDTVANILYSGSSIPLRDYNSGTTRPWIERMIVDDIVTDTPIPNEDYHQYNYTISISWTRQWDD